MAISNESNGCYVIDVFDNQKANLDNSGSGDLNQFKNNLKNFGINLENIVIDARMSSDVKSTEILSKVPKARFFHIDGGHHLEAVQDDLKLSLEVLNDYGIIAVDDVFRPEWPEVSLGALTFSELGENDYFPFAIGFNKTFWCKENLVEEYQNALLKNRYLSLVHTKTYAVKRRPIFIFQKYPLPEWSAGTLLMWYLEIYRPDFFMKIAPATKSLKSALKKFLRRP